MAFGIGSIFDPSKLPAADPTTGVTETPPVVAGVPAEAPPPIQPRDAWTNPARDELYKTLASRYGADAADMQPETLKRAQDSDRWAQLGVDAGNRMTSAMFQAAGMTAPEQKVPSEVAALQERRKALMERLGFDKGIREEAEAQKTGALKQTEALEGRDPGSAKSRATRAAAETVLRLFGLQTPPELANASHEDVYPLLQSLEKSAVAKGQLDVAKATAALTAWNARFAQGVKQYELNREATKDTFVIPGAVPKPGVAVVPPEVKKEIGEQVALLPQLEQRAADVKSKWDAYKSAPLVDKPHAFEAYNKAMWGLTQAWMGSEKMRMNPRAAELAKERLPGAHKNEVLGLGEDHHNARVDQFIQGLRDNLRATAEPYYDLSNTPYGAAATTTHGAGTVESKDIGGHRYEKHNGQWLDMGPTVGAH